MSAGAVISNNTAERSGGGVYVGVSSTTSVSFTMNGGTITGNTAKGPVVTTGATYGGGGVAVAAAGSTFTMTGGTISQNSAVDRGGGVRALSGTFIMSGGTISGNTGTEWGGGVEVYNTNAQFHLLGGTISGNNSSRGGGVSYRQGTFRIVNGTIYGNETTVAEALRNTAQFNSAALTFEQGATVQHGTYSVPGNITSTWTQVGTITATTANTINIVNGVVTPLP